MIFYDAMMRREPAFRKQARWPARAKMGDGDAGLAVGAPLGCAATISAEEPILLSGIGSVLGPLIGMSLKESFGIDGIFYLIIVAATILAVIAAGRSLTSALPSHLIRPFEMLAPQVPVIAHEPPAAREQQSRRSP
jgi:hypothetical protein